LPIAKNIFVPPKTFEFCLPDIADRQKHLCPAKNI
jgi:hypothetical protein